MTNKELKKLMLEYNEFSQNRPYEKFGLIHYYLKAQHQKDVEWIEERIKSVTKEEVDDGKTVLLPIRLSDWKIFREGGESRNDKG